MNVQNLLEGSNPYNVFQNQANKLAKKWGKSGLLEGYAIKTDTDRNNMAVLLENQAKQLVLEANQTGTGASFSAGNSEAWAGVALPLVRRVFGEIVAKDLISVQPMNLPSGLIFYLDFRYGTSQSPFGVNDSLYAATADMKKTSGDATRVGGRGEGLYGAGRFGYSINETTSSALTWAAAVTDDNYTSASAVFTGILNADTEFSASVVDDGSTFGVDGTSTIYTVQISTGSFKDYDPEGVRAFTLSGSAMNTYYPQFTRKYGNVIEFVVSSSAGSALDDLVVTYQKGPDNLDDRGDFEDSIPAGVGAVSTLDIPEINVQLRSDTVTAKTRKLKAQWTPEFAQDLNAYHSIDAEAELTSILSEYISMEIDLEVLDMLIRNADTQEAWSAKVAREVDSTGAIIDESGTGVYYTKMSWFQTLGVKLEKVSNLIHQKTLRGGANWMVVSPKISTILESIPGFAADSAGDKDKYNMGVQKVGSVNNRWTVYKNPYLTENIILMGYKGSQFLETGAVFAPYIPLIMTPLVYDPASFTPKKGIMTRYAKKMVRPDFYGKVYIRDLNTI